MKASVIHRSENLTRSKYLSFMSLLTTFTSSCSDLPGPLAIIDCLLIMSQTRYKWWLSGEHFLNIIILCPRWIIKNSVFLWQMLGQHYWNETEKYNACFIFECNLTCLTFSYYYFNLGFYLFSEEFIALIDSLRMNLIPFHRKVLWEWVISTMQKGWLKQILMLYINSSTY